jgi:hypothetical protein
LPSDPNARAEPHRHSEMNPPNTCPHHERDPLGIDTL